MLSEYFNKIGESAFVKRLRGFLDSVWYIVLVAFLMTCANLFSLELIVFYLYLALGILIVLFDDDLKGIIPIGCCAYMTISYKNNPAMSISTSAFYRPAFKIQLVVLIALAAVALLVRLVSILVRGEKKKMPSLLLGFVALGAAFMLGGLFSEFYGLRTAFFGLVVILSLCAYYFLFYYGVDWKQSGKDYFAQLFLVIGLFLLVELLGIYVISGALKNGLTDRAILQTGWGMYNNVGCVLCMCLPAPLYLAIQRKRGWLYTAVAIVMFGGIILTQSRGSMIVAAPIAVIGGVLLLVKCRKEERLYHLIVVGTAALIGIALMIVFRHAISKLFSDMLGKTFGDDILNERGRVYKEGMQHFTSHPYFGVGFYQCTAFRWGELSADAFLPPRYHNTIVQVLASGGVFCLVCYLFHRVQTGILLFRRPSLEKTFLALGIAGFLLTSLTECHFFSFGPALLYSVLLVCAEGENMKRAAEEKAERKAE